MRSALLALLIAGCTSRFARETTAEAFPATPEDLSRGKYLVDAVTACGACHTGRKSGMLPDPEDPQHYLSGGNIMEDVGSFKLFVPNLTSDAETGLGKWSDDRIARAIRDGVDDEGNLLFPAMPFISYQHMSDRDVRAIVAYLRTVPKTKPVGPEFERDLPFISKMGMGLGMVHHEPVKGVKMPDPKDRVAYGRYVLSLAHCEECHALGGRGPKSEDDKEFMGGSDKPFTTRGVGKVWAPNLTPDPEFGIARYGDAQVKDALRTGMRLADGKPMAFPMSSYIPHYSRMTAEDLDALIAYLRSLKPVHKQVPPPQLSTSQ
jgi:mono/diheme cytochrome c family protein